MSIEELQAALATLPAEGLVPNTPPWFRHLILSKRLVVARGAAEALGEIDPQIACLEQQQADLTAVRAEICDELSNCPPTETVRFRGLRISLLAIDERFNLAHEALPMPLPLFEKLAIRGYVAPSRAPWNPIAALSGPLPSVERRLVELQKQRAQAQSQLDRALRDPVTV